MRYAVMGWIAVGWMVAAACSSGGGGGSSATVESQAIRFADCTAARDYLVENLQSERELTAFADGVAVLTGGEAAHDAQAGGEAAPEEREFSNTNVQEVGVDEADFVKTDGDYLYAVSGATFLLIDAWPAAATAELGRYEVEGDPFALYVHGDVAALLSRLWQAPESAPELEPRGGTLVKVTVLDVTDKAAPALVREIYLEGSYVDSRMVAGRVYVVTSYEQPVTADAGSAGDGGVVEGGTGVVASATATDVAPLFPRRLDRIAGDTQGEVEPVCGCEEIYRPAEPNGPGVISLVAVDLAHPTAELAATALVSDGGTVYGAQESLYLATANDGPWLWWGAPVVAVTDGVQAAAVADPTPKTVIHKFTLGATPTYAASGTVAGWVLNSYSMSEHAGILRIATTEENWWSGGDPVNAVYTLAQQGDRLERVGAVTGLGKPGERIYAVRFLGDRGFVVTFQQIDPLVALDLSDPAAPRVAGELEVEGLSTYLHPIGADRLLAVGQEVGGVNLSLFDVSDLAHPRLVAQQALGAGSYSEAQYDPKAFTYFAALGVLALPVSAWTDLTVAAGESPTYDLFNGLYLYDVDPAAGFTLRGTLDHSDLYRDEANGFWYAPSEIRRSFFLRDAAAGTFVYSVSHRGVKVSDFADLTTVATVDLPAPPTYWLVDDTVVALPEPAAVLP
jgi:hypothetical protein